MEVSNVLIENKDGAETRSHTTDVPSAGELSKQVQDENVKKRRRCGKSKRKVMKPFIKVPWQNRKVNEKSKRNNRFRKLVLTKTHAPYNNNQFLMEIHKPEPENNFQIMQTPSARTRDSSFSVDSDENYFYSLPEDEEDFLTKEFSSVYEDAQTERLSSMSKAELIQEYLLLEAKYDNLLKRTERSKVKVEEDRDTSGTDKDTTATDKENMSSDRDTTATSAEFSMTEDTTMQEVVQRVKEQEDQIRELKIANEKLKHENEHLSRRSPCSSSADSESDSSSTSGSCSSSSRSTSPVPLDSDTIVEEPLQVTENVVNSSVEAAIVSEYPLVNGFHNGSNPPTSEDGLME